MRSLKTCRPSAPSQSRRLSPAAQLAVAEPLEARRLLSSYATASYFPLSAGNTWTYTGSYDANGANFTATDTKASSITTFNGATVTELADTITNDGGSMYRWYAYSPTVGVELYGNEQIAGNGTTQTYTFDTPENVLTPTLTDGQVISWSNVGVSFVSTNGASAVGTDTGNTTVEGATPVTTNNGWTFDALRLVTTHNESYTGSNGDVTFTMTVTIVETRWLASGVGIVQVSDSSNFLVTDEGHTTPSSFGSSYSLSKYVPATPVTPVFGNLSDSSTIPQGTAAATFSGTIAAGALTPPTTETVAITLNGVTRNTAINAQGNFTTTFNTSALAAATTPYQVTYAYAGDATFTSVTDNSTTKLTVIPGAASIAGTIYSDLKDTGVWNPTDPELPDVMVYLDANNNGKLDAGEISVNTDANGNYLFTDLAAGYYTVREVVPGNYTQTLPAVGYIDVSLSAGQAITGQTFLDAPTGNATNLPVYRLYSPVTLEHLYTTDANEYNTLESYLGIWNGEGEVWDEYSAPATVGGVADEPLYRLYDAADKQHFWTDNYNEYNTLRNAPWNWNDEGIVGYVFPTAVAGTALTPLYRMSAPQVHLWTTDVNEYDTLAGEGWTQEGIIGYVL